jgi:hypothetical protein
MLSPLGILTWLVAGSGYEAVTVTHGGTLVSDHLY